jgi:type VII secretion protein EccB
MLQRVVGALAMRDPDPVTSPLRRIGGALFAGVMVAVLALAAVGVYGALRPAHNESWRSANTVIIEEETGARFVYRDGVLYPVLNYSSALLIIGSAEATRASVPHSAFAGVPRGAPLGIAGAPDLLPAADELITQPWTMCSRPAQDPSAGAESVLRIGSAAASGAGHPGARGILAADPAGGLHLLWHDRRFAITAPDLVLAAFAWSREAVTALAPALLNALPVGPDLGAVNVERSDKPSAVAGLRVGEVFVVANQSGARQFGVARAAGVAEITPLQADLLIAGGANGLGGRPRDLGLAQYASAPRVASLVPTGQAAPPASPPEVIRPDGAVCATFASGGGAPEVSLAAAGPPAPGELRASRAAGDEAPTVDWVAVAPGRGAVVEALAGPTSPNGALCVISDLGVRYPVPTRDVLAVLGYSGVTPQRLPASLVALLPTGNALDPNQAVRPVIGGG